MVVNNKIGSLASSTGGVKIFITSELKSAAGNARYVVKDKETAAPKHHATIKLCDKILDTDDELINTLAHEFCHLANRMISRTVGQSHGVKFKEWGRKVEKAFGNRNIKITRCHSYPVEYKYIWKCKNTACGTEYKRQKRMVTKKRVCGRCRGELEVKKA